jgi:RHS repeat-associated protein
VSKNVTVSLCEGALITVDSQCPANSSGSKTVHTFGVQFSRNEGQLLSTSVLERNGSVLKVTSNTYVSEAEMASQPFPRNAGTTLLDVFKNPMVNRLRPTREVSIAQDVADFTIPNFATRNNSFDAFGTPTNVTRTGVGTNSACTEATTFEHNLVKWVTGQVKTRSGCDVPVQTDYDVILALPIRQYQGGLLKSTLAYYDSDDTDNVGGNDHQVGDLKSVTDGNGKATTLSDYYLGIPRRVDFPTGAYESATVNNKAQITSVTDENGYATSYGYDAMSRVNLVTPPSGDSVAWVPMSITFAPVNADEYHVPAGHWKRTLIKGNYRSVTVYDGMWRPVVTTEWDNSLTGTQRYSWFAYDTEGRKTFASYPGAVAPDVVSPKSPGTRTTYDALGRATRNEQDSELGVLTTQTNYLSGFKAQVINPRLFATTTEFWARGEPGTDQPEKISAPEGVTTTILHDAETGFTTSVNRSGTYAGAPVSTTRSYVYDSNDRLCLRIEPETGTTVMDYDGAGNVSWSAAGQTATSCASRPTLASAIPATQKTLRTYDAVNRIKLVDVPNSTNDPTYTYFADGRLQSLVNGTATWTYTYNKLRLPVTETLDFGGKVRTLAHGYNVYGAENSQTYPDGLFVAITPNALGQASRAGIYATGVGYFPNGGMSGFTYANGVVHSMTPNARQLPDRSLDQKPGQAAVLDDSYDYDFNGNVAAITDGVVGGGGNRTMTYDGLDRLTSTDAPNLAWINATTMYDPLDNIRRNKVGSRTWNYVYDANNRLSQLKDYTTGAIMRGIATDARGNIIADGAQGLSFDLANRLTAATGKESYAYDGHGRRVWINRTSDNKASFPMYSLAGQLVTEDDLRTNVTTDYVYLNGSLVAKRYQTIGDTLWTTRYLHTDALGTPVAETDTAGTVQMMQRYSPYGEPSTYRQGPGFTGHVTDAVTGLSYMQQRYYDPILGRFLAADPVESNPKSGVNFNRYWYANDNPYAFRDPDGRYVCKSDPTSCGQIDTAMSKMRKAVNNSRTSPQERRILNRLLNFYGKAWEKNGVNISTTTSSNDSGSAVKINGQIEITLNMSAHTNSNGSINTVDLAATLAHEGTHGQDASRYGNVPNGNATQENWREKRAAFSETIIYKAENVDSPFGTWTRSGGLDAEAIEREADTSTGLWCSAHPGGNC